MSAAAKATAEKANKRLVAEFVETFHVGTEHARAVFLAP